MDVVEAQRHRGDEALQGDGDGQAEVLLQQRVRERAHRLRLFEVQPGRGESTQNKAQGRESNEDSGELNARLTPSRATIN